jgi:hypothetical protein
MTTAVALLRAGGRAAVVFAMFALSVFAVAYVSAEPTQLRTAVTVGLFLVVAAVGIARPQGLLYTIAAWLIVLGLVRRILTLVAPATGPDPLLLVGPLAVGLLVVAVLQRERFPRRTALSTSVAVISVIIAVSALNPAQGGLAVGVAGLLFLLVPLLGFWIGRTLCTDVVFARLLKLVATLALPVAAYGLYQTFVGFPRWDNRWILDVQQAYQALNVGLAIRPFSTLPSSAEYAYVVAVGLAIWLAFGLRGFLRLPVTAAAVGLLGTALILESSRLVVFLCAAGLVAMVVGRLRISAPVAAVAVLLSVLVVSAGVGRLAPDYYAQGTTGALVGHQLQGLSNPIDSKSSTFFIHLSLITEGLRSGVAHPAGLGAGAVSQAAGKFGGTGRQSEADPSNLAIAAGLPGLAVYLVIAVLAFVRAYALARARRDALSLSALAIITIVFLRWFNGGQYGIALLLWITIGWIDASWIRLKRTQQ